MNPRPQLAVLILLLLSLVAPPMACAQPNAANSGPQPACCVPTPTQCGAMQMPASRACCQAVPANPGNNALQIRIQTVPASLHLLAASLTAWDRVAPDAAPSAWLTGAQLPPPESPPPATANLKV